MGIARFTNVQITETAELLLTLHPWGKYLCVLELRLKTSCVLGKLNTLFLCFF